MRLVFDLQNFTNTVVFLRTSRHAFGSSQNPLRENESVPLYRITTPVKLFGADTTYYHRFNPNFGGETLWATAVFKGAFSWGDNKVTYMGQDIKISNFVPQTNVLTRSRVLRVTNGARFKWKIGGPFNGRLDLFDDHKRLVASFKYSSLPFSGERYYIDIVDELIPTPADVDLILLSATLISRVEAQRKARARAHALGTSAGAKFITM